MSSGTPSFRDLGVSDAVIESLAARGIEAPFPIQVMVIQDATEGRDTLAKSKTGSGKTLGFAIPIVEQLDPEVPKRPEALVLVPTRELCTQVKDDFTDIARAKGLKVKAVYGGTNVKEQAKGADTAHILIATPGRLDDLVERRLVKLGGVRIFVLDEADRMLDMGFQPQVDRIVRHLPKDRQTMFFSATLDGAVGRIAEVYTRNPVRHEIESDSQTVDEADHKFIPVESHGKLNKLIELARAEEETGLTLVFVNTKRHVETLARQLRNQGVPTVTMHGDMTQQARETRADSGSRTSTSGVLIATDVAARGLDLDDISLVVNYDPPQDDKGYVHRVGRTARAGRTGTSITFVTPDQAGRRQPDGRAPRPARGVRAGGHEGRAAADRVQRERGRPPERARASPAVDASRRAPRPPPGGSSSADASRGCPPRAPAWRSRSPGRACSRGRPGPPLASVSMPSASGVIPRLWASEIIADTMLAASRSLSNSRTNERSILRMSTGMCFRRASDE